MTSERLQWKSLLVFVAELSPYEVHFPSSEQLLIGMTVEGNTTGTLRTKHTTSSMSVLKNNIIVFPKDTEFVASFDASFKMVFIYVSNSTVDKIFKEFSLITGSYFDFGQPIYFSDQYLVQAITSLTAMMSSSIKELELETSYIVRALLARIASKYAIRLSSCRPSNCFLPRIQSALNYIENNLHSCISLSQLAKEVGLEQFPIRKHHTRQP